MPLFFSWATDIRGWEFWIQISKTPIIHLLCVTSACAQWFDKYTFQRVSGDLKKSKDKNGNRITQI